MEELSSLWGLETGETGIVDHMTLPPHTEGRLQSFGLIPGTETECLMRAPGGEPCAFRVRGAVIALRRRECEGIMVRRVTEHGAPRAMTVILAGNPNVGKSTVFNGLTGMRQHTGNWCGKTVESAKGFATYKGSRITVLDTPGTYSLLSASAEEQAAVDTLCSVPHDCVICVCDATRLERGLILALQILEMTRKMVLCINCMDAARQQGISVDTAQLSGLLGIPVIGVTARQKRTLEPLLEAVMEQAAMHRTEGMEIRYPQIAERAIGAVMEPVAAALPEAKQGAARWYAVHLLMHNPRLQLPPCSEEKQQAAAEALRCGKHLLHEGNMTTRQYENLVAATVILRASGICAKTVTVCEKTAPWEERLDRLLADRRFGGAFMALLLFGVFWLTVVGANVPSAMLFTLLERCCDLLGQAAAEVHLPPMLCGALIDGALRGTCRVISVMLPPMAIFFPLFTLLEDSGLLPRIAFRADGALAKCHACGKQSLTMAMGFGCNAVGVSECRIIGSRRERLIAVLTNSFVPCNGRFPQGL